VYHWRARAAAVFDHALLTSTATQTAEVPLFVCSFVSLLAVAAGSCGGLVRPLLQGLSSLPLGGGSSMERTKVLCGTPTRAGMTAKAGMLMQQAGVLIDACLLRAQLVVELPS